MKNLCTLILILTLLPGISYGKSGKRKHVSFSDRENKAAPKSTVMFRPTHEAMLLQNTELDRMGLTRIDNDGELKTLVENGSLVPLPHHEAAAIDPHLPENRRYCRPWTAQFISDLSAAYYARFHSPIMVDSAVRTVQTQKSLIRWNRNAAPAQGDAASSHLAGTTIDLARRRMTKEQTQFVELWLLPLVIRGQVIVEEESGQFCFHIMVMRSYDIFEGLPESWRLLAQILSHPAFRRGI